MERSSRRGFLSLVGGATTGIGLAVIGTAAANQDVTFKRTFVDSAGDRIANAQINLGYFDQDEDEYVRKSFSTGEDGTIRTTVPSGARLRMGFYKSSNGEFLAPRLDGVPHIHTLDPITVADEGTDSGEYRLPEAYTLEARAFLGGPPNGVEDAIPRFASVSNGSYYASGYSYTTTDENGYMKLNAADFTGVEMAGETRIWMYPPTYEPYKEQDRGNYGPYSKVTTRDVEVTEDTTIEMNIRRRRKKGDDKGKGKKKGN